ncbi:hypothetical protein BKK52_02570 [Rodentibacter trehalosifermentans]|uniref:DUF805 domain-containing protein n=1 Tax=Rodentibacter trehalosifermentans TaxID=1908263 RepID=A0A1V3J4J6_9PAST|nr:DUF805 domain-containing protein [Rodentibacter trehalosifermentans]OOF49903.1 hypothetical protein BKK52_02570 [Rodentibacter trehalosifermentans]
MSKLKKIWNFLFGFKGRIGRLHFAIFLPFLLIVSMVCFTLILTCLDIIRAPLVEVIYKIIAIGIMLILFFFQIIFKYSHIARRIHDYDKCLGNSGLGITIILIEIIAILLSFVGMGEYIRLLAIIGIICFIALALIKGTKGENQFGSEPIPFWKKHNITQKQE